MLPAGRMAYIVENTPLQYNWKHPGVRSEDFGTICTAIGEPACLDAAQFGFYAHRLRDFWTNLGDAKGVQQRAGRCRPVQDRPVQDILSPGVWASTSRVDDAWPQFVCNQRGKPMRVWPTLMASSGVEAMPSLDILGWEWLRMMEGT